VGVGGVALLLRRRRRIPGLCLLGIYGAFGLYGLAHFVVAPPSAHTVAANISVWLEVVTALLVVGLVAVRLHPRWSRSPMRGGA
jgi:hypothetical protein